LLIGFQDTAENVRDVFLGHSVEPVGQLNVAIYRVGQKTWHLTSIHIFANY